jgi:hypothetical protein
VVVVVVEVVVVVDVVVVEVVVVEVEVVVVVGGAPEPKTGAISSRPDIPVAMMVTVPVVVSRRATSPVWPAIKTPPRPSAAIPSGDTDVANTLPTAQVSVPIISCVTVLPSRPDTKSAPVVGSYVSPSGAPPGAIPVHSVKARLI